jgi:hypothetical protein
MESVRCEAVLASLACVLAGCDRPSTEKQVESLVDDLVECSRASARLTERIEAGRPASQQEAVEWFNATIEALVEAEYPSASKDGARARSALFEMDREAIGAVIGRLGTLALDTQEGRSAGEFLTRWLGEAFCGGSSWEVSPFVGGPDEDRSHVQAWTALLERVRSDEGLWRLPRYGSCQRF